MRFLKNARGKFYAAHHSLKVGEMENPQVKKRFLQLADACDEEYESFAVMHIPTPSPSMVVPMQGQLNGQYLVRNCYVELYDIIMASKARAVIVTGNPGIGKSAFYVYFYTRLLSDERRPEHVLVYENTKEEAVLYVHNGEVKEVQLSQEKQDLFDRMPTQPVWRIIDGCNENVKSHLGRTIVFSSPNCKKLKLLKKDVDRKTLYVPPWNLQELNFCRERFYPSLSYDELVRRFCEFGGVPRFVFTAEQSDVSSTIAGAFGKANFRKHVELPITMEQSDYDNYSHRLLHMIPCENYSNYYLKFASESIGSRIFHEYFAECRNDLFKFLVESEGVMEASGYRGYLFEMLAHQKLSAGGEFSVKNLQTKEISLVELPPSEVIIFSKASELNPIDDTKYYRPQVKNYESLDSFRANWLFQMGVGPTHPVKIHGIRKFLTARGLFANGKITSASPMRLYFVVPPNRFESYSVQKFVSKNVSAEPEESSGNISNWTLSIEQYAIKIEFCD